MTNTLHVRTHMSLDTASKFIAKYDMRENDWPRTAIDRTRKRLRSAADSGHLQRYPDGSFRSGALIAWAIRTYPDAHIWFQGLLVDPYVEQATLGDTGLCGTPNITAILRPTTLDECHRAIDRLCEVDSQKNRRIAELEAEVRQLK